MGCNFVSSNNILVKYMIPDVMNCAPEVDMVMLRNILLTARLVHLMFMNP